jgi:hypothetical protein
MLFQQINFLKLPFGELRETTSPLFKTLVSRGKSLSSEAAALSPETDTFTSEAEAFSSETDTVTSESNAFSSDAFSSDAFSSDAFSSGAVCKQGGLLVDCGNLLRNHP